MMNRTSWLKQMRQTTEAMYDLWSSIDFYEADEEAANGRVAVHVQYLDEFLGYIAPRSRLLSAGCGDGTYEGMLLEASHSVVGIDISEGLLSHARKLYPAVRYEKMALHEMDFRSEFDGAICIESLEHVFPEEWPVIIQGFREALKPGGILYFTVDVVATDWLEEQYERARSRGLPVVFGEVADGVEEASKQVIAARGDVPDEVSDRSVYHYYPGIERVRTWLEEQHFKIVTQGTGTFAWGSDSANEATYEHFVVRKEQTSARDTK